MRTFYNGKRTQPLQKLFFCLHVAEIILFSNHFTWFKLLLFTGGNPREIQKGGDPITTIPLTMILQISPVDSCCWKVSALVFLWRFKRLLSVFECVRDDVLAGKRSFAPLQEMNLFCSVCCQTTPKEKVKFSISFPNGSLCQLSVNYISIFLTLFIEEGHASPCFHFLN